MPFLEGDVLAVARKAMEFLTKWTREHWGEDEEIVVSGDDKTASSARMPTRRPARSPEPSDRSESGERRRRSFTNPSSPDLED